MYPWIPSSKINLEPNDESGSDHEVILDVGGSIRELGACPIGLDRAPGQPPYITWEDVFNGRIHRTKDSKPLAEAARDITKSSDNQ